jgi:hypothetical protein
MKEDLEKTVDLNLAARVMLVCSTHGIKDPVEINSRRENLKQEIMQRIAEDNIGVDGLSDLMDGCIGKLEFELEHGTDKSDQMPASKEPVEEKQAADQYPTVQDVKAKKRSGYQPHAEEMTKKLESERKPIQNLLLEDCVQLRLLEQKRAEYLVTQFAGKLPHVAEEEVVIELRNNLHQQVRRFMRKHKGGPWASPKDQEELRLEIARTPTVRSTLHLTRQLLRERRQWLNKSKKSLTGRLFGSRLKMEKDKK